MNVIQTEQWKGYTWALIGTISFSSLYVFSKAGLNQVDLAQFGLYYFGMGFLLNLLLVVFSVKISEIRQLSRKML
jgi:hypothetical protein